MKHLGTVELCTKRLILRKFTSGDGHAMYKNWASDPLVTKYLTWRPHRDEKTSAEVASRWEKESEKGDFYQWRIVLKDLGEPIGGIGVVDFDEKINKVQIGYCIGRKWWRQGYTSEALAALIDFFFRCEGVNRVERRHDTNNPASGGVMRNCNMKYEGTLRSADINNWGVCDVAYYGILREEWEKTRER